ncbi:hypothetical protein J6590_068639 [Homalodisca vitripennis]|nr:hypothetical protein J6590_068639 [Homalodisca vitripennis]
MENRGNILNKKLSNTVFPKAQYWDTCYLIELPDIIVVNNLYLYFDDTNIVGEEKDPKIVEKSAINSLYSIRFQVKQSPSKTKFIQLKTYQSKYNFKFDIRLAIQIY